jgi:hypothetical protein
MNLFTIQWASTNLPNQRYIIFNDGKTSAIYKRFLWIIYIRVSKSYNNNEAYIKLLTKYKTLINEIQ